MADIDTDTLCCGGDSISLKKLIAWVSAVDIEPARDRRPVILDTFFLRSLVALSGRLLGSLGLFGLFGLSKTSRAFLKLPDLWWYSLGSEPSVSTLGAGGGIGEAVIEVEGTRIILVFCLVILFIDWVTGTVSVSAEEAVEGCSKRPFRSENFFLNSGLSSDLRPKDFRLLVEASVLAGWAAG